MEQVLSHLSTSIEASNRPLGTFSCSLPLSISVSLSLSHCISAARLATGHKTTQTRHENTIVSTVGFSPDAFASGLPRNSTRLPRPKPAGRAVEGGEFRYWNYNISSPLPVRSLRTMEQPGRSHLTPKKLLASCVHPQRSLLFLCVCVGAAAAAAYFRPLNSFGAIVLPCARVVLFFPLRSLHGILSRMDGHP